MPIDALTTRSVAAARDKTARPVFRAHLSLFDPVSTRAGRMPCGTVGSRMPIAGRGANMLSAKTGTKDRNAKIGRGTKNERSTGTRGDAQRRFRPNI